VSDNTILDAVATVRDTIAHAETNDIPLCVITHDFQHKFDSISHEYLFSILRSYGLSARLVALMKNLYTDDTSAVQINGDLHGPISIRCGVRQVCPLSMTLYTLCPQPFLNMLEQRLPGARIGRGNRPISVMANADDVTILLTSRTDIPAIEDAIRLFENASGAHLNTRKSQALPIGRWNTSANITDMPYHPHLKEIGRAFLEHYTQIDHRHVDTTHRQSPSPNTRSILP